eukprot:scaffold1289_cov274-Pinguiococcus_pyrenoidosus.AAC.5
MLKSPPNHLIQVFVGMLVALSNVVKLGSRGFQRCGARSSGILLNRRNHTASPSAVFPRASKRDRKVRNESFPGAR